MLEVVATDAQAEKVYKKIDHIAIAVVELEEGIDFYCNTLGFKLIRRRSISGKRTGMISAELEHHGIKFVLCQGTEPESQVSRLIQSFGPGVAHLALAVDDVEAVANDLREKGLAFDTTVIKGSGLTQVFSSRDPNSGLSFEFIQRNGEHEFLEENVQQLFAQLEASESY